MNRQYKPRPLLIRDPAYRPAFQRLNEALEREPEISAAERCREIFGPSPADREAVLGAARVNDPAESD
jgi:hypothetical protein